MEEKGFTLIEIIAVIVVLSLILLIIVPNMTNTINNSKNKLNDTQKELIISAARNWGTANLTLENNKPVPSEVTIQTLQDKGYLDDKEIKNMTDKTTISKSSKICIKWENNQYTYTYKETGSC